MRRHALPAGALHRARALRREATPAERLLWRALRTAFPEAHFRRQAPLGPYIVDLCSHSARLIVEVDGSQHAEAQAYDAARTRFLRGEGYRALRFWNNEVLENLDGVLTVIAAALPELPPRKRVREETAPYTSSPLPPCGGERREAAAEGGADAERRRAVPLRTPTPTPPHKGEGLIGANTLRALSLRDSNPHPSLPHKGEGGIVKPPVWSL